MIRILHLKVEAIERTRQNSFKLPLALASGKVETRERLLAEIKKGFHLGFSPNAFRLKRFVWISNLLLEAEAIDKK